MKFIGIAPAAWALILACAATVSAQSLADVARKEEARRKVVRSSGKVYTNDALPSGPAPSGATAPAAPAPSVQPTAPSEPSADAPAVPTPGAPAAAEAPAGALKTEADWRARVGTERDVLSRAQMFAEALQSRINALSADFVNRDDPAQRAQVAAERQKALAELDRVKQEIEQHQKAIATIQGEARRAGVPAGWTR